MATPFVAGVAALVKAADPSLGPDGIWDVLKATAHDRKDVGAEVTGHQRRINARDAVATALGVQLAAPSVKIDAPSPGAEVAHGEWVDLLATATDYQGKPLPVTWSSSIDGTLASKVVHGAGTDGLSPGEHTITVSAVDALGVSTATGVNLVVADPTPSVRVLGPDSGSSVALTQDVVLAGEARDTRGFALPAEDVRWTVTRHGLANPVATASGEIATIPAGSLPPGLYQARLTGSVAGATASDSTAFTVVVPEPGKEPPVIVAPAGGTELGALPADGTAPVRLEGYALDAAGEHVPGTQLRWTAESSLGEEITLCAGTQTPPGGGGGGAGPSAGGGLAAGQVSCSTVDTQLRLPSGAASVTWTITLEVYDAGGLRGQTRTAVRVRLAVG